MYFRAVSAFCLFIFGIVIAFPVVNAQAQPTMRTFVAPECSTCPDCPTPVVDCEGVPGGSATDLGCGCNNPADLVVIVAIQLLMFVEDVLELMAMTQQ